MAHVTECARSSGWPPAEKHSYLLAILGHGTKSFWLLVLARPTIMLSDLDALIRDVWVECCGHLSQFTIHGEHFMNDAEECETGMDIPLGRILAPGMTFSYEYDFGSTTVLDIHVLSTLPISPPGRGAVVLARNRPPPVPCDECGNPADFRLFDENGIPSSHVCRRCLQPDRFSASSVMRISNSPRDGVCGYEEDPVSALAWYPPGWTIDELADREIEDLLDSVGE